MADSSCLVAKYKNIASVMPILLQSFHLQNPEVYKIPANLPNARPGESVTGERWNDRGRPSARGGISHGQSTFTLPYPRSVPGSPTYPAPRPM
jgi:hypothetical protein